MTIAAVRGVSISVACAFVAWCAPAGAQVRIEGLSERPPDRISIFTVRGKGIFTPLIAFQEEARQEVEAHLHAQIVSMDEMFRRGDLSFQEMVECRGDPGCFADRIGTTVDARYLLVITASLVADTKLVGARLIDLEKKSVVGEALKEIDGDFLEAVPARIREAVPKDWWDPFGSLSIQVDQPGAQLTVRGRVVGMSPLGSLAYLLPGTYDVSATKPGFLPARGSATVSRGGQARLAIAMQREPEPASSTWWIWIAVGAAVVVGGGVATGVVLGTRDTDPPSFCTAPGGTGC